MNDTRQLRTTWVEFAQSYAARMSHPELSAKEFDSTLTRCLDELVNATLGNTRGTIDDEHHDAIARRMKATRDEIIKAKDGNFRRLSRSYGHVYAQWENFRNQRRQHNWATTWDYAKMFLSRTAQAVMIAAVVLTASYVAKELGIPLPYFRIAP